MNQRNLLQRGADPTGQRAVTALLQQMIDEVAAAGGGRIVIPAGIYRCGTIRMCSRLEIEMESGAVLRGSSDLADYPEQSWGHNKDRQPHHFILAEDCEEVTWRGGIVEGSGRAFWHPEPSPSGWFREKSRRPSPMLEWRRCRRVLLEGVTLRDSPGWTCHLHDCEDVELRGVRVLNDRFGPNTDGFDINGCRDVRISDCLLDTGDDAIVLKTTPDARACARIAVSNCIIRSNCVGLKLGAAESYHPIRDVVFSNCIVHGSHRMIGLHSYNGADYENIFFQNITGDTLGTAPLARPIHLDLRSDREGVPAGKIRHVVIAGFSARTNGRILLTAEHPGHLSDLVLRDVILDYPKIEDPVPHLPAPGRGSVQFSNRNLEARAVRAAIIAENITRLSLDHVRLCGPRDGTAFPFASLWARGVTYHKMDVQAEPWPEEGGGGS